MARGRIGLRITCIMPRHPALDRQAHPDPRRACGMARDRRAAHCADREGCRACLKLLLRPRHLGGQSEGLLPAPVQALPAHRHIRFGRRLPRGQHGQ
eukprot:3187456-Prymnesium_polylepis.1